MKDFIGFTKRNILIYFKDVLAIIFSLMTSMIVFVLYLLFLKDTFVDALTATMKGLENIVSSGDIDMFVNGMLLSGILGSTLITVLEFTSPEPVPPFTIRRTPLPNTASALPSAFRGRTPLFSRRTMPSAAIRLTLSILRVSRLETSGFVGAKILAIFCSPLLVLNKNREIKK